MQIIQSIQNRIYVIRGERVMLDFDLAELYEVGTRVLNQAVKRNSKRFPEDFMFQLTDYEWATMRSQIVTSSQIKKLSPGSYPHEPELLQIIHQVIGWFVSTRTKARDTEIKGLLRNNHNRMIIRYLYKRYLLIFPHHYLLIAIRHYLLILPHHYLLINTYKNGYSCRKISWVTGGIANPSG